MIKLSGKDDTRFLVRGKINWGEVELELNDLDSFSAQVYHRVKTLVKRRNNFKAFGHGSIEWLNVYNRDNKIENGVLSYIREFRDEKILVLNNLSASDVWIHTDIINEFGSKDILGQKLILGKEKGHLLIKGHGYYWINLN